MRKHKLAIVPKDLAVLKLLEAHEAQWVDYDPKTHGPRQPFEYYEDGRHWGDDIETAVTTLQIGEGLGVMPVSGIYAVRFRAKDDLSAFTLIQSVMGRAGANIDVPPPVTATKDGDYVALFLIPAQADADNYRNLVVDAVIPERVEKVTLYLGSRTAVPFLGPIGKVDQREAAVENCRLQELNPEAWAHPELLAKDKTEFLTVEGRYRRRLGQAKNHLKVVLAGIQPLDDAWKVLEAVAADLVAGFKLNPNDGLALMKKPLGKVSTGQSFLEHLAYRLPASRGFTIQALSKLFDEAVDAVSPMGVAAFQRREAKIKWASLLETLAGIPSLTTPAMISAERLRLAFCELTGVDPQHMNQTVFGTMLGKAIRAGKIPVQKNRFVHPTMGDHTIYVGIDEALLKQALYWQSERLSRRTHRKAG